jgi:hypothetical protein
LGDKSAYKILDGKPEKDERIILKQISGKLNFGDVNLIYLAQDRDWLRGLLNTGTFMFCNARRIS